MQARGETGVMLWIIASALLIELPVQKAPVTPEISDTMGEIKFATSPAGSDFYFSPDTGQISQDRKRGKVRVRIVHSQDKPKLFEHQSASSIGYFDFDCVKRTYLVDMRQYFDERNRLMSESKYPIIVGMPPQSVTKEIEIVYAAACMPSFASPGL
jgi:hypothetical protein